MLITFKLYASLTEFLPLDRRKGNAMTLEVPAGATVDQIVTRFALPMKMVHLVLIDGVYVPPEARATRPLAEGETLAIWPPIAGG
ncbi:MAG TPA: MoaD/ThiS family protein [Rubrivivax sp.]|nr:MoaD/ThiS family protein [Rubrivivax sp.]